MWKYLGRNVLYINRFHVGKSRFIELINYSICFQNNGSQFWAVLLKNVKSELANSNYFLLPSDNHKLKLYTKIPPNGLFTAKSSAVNHTFHKIQTVNFHKSRTHLNERSRSIRHSLWNENPESSMYVLSLCLFLVSFVLSNHHLKLLKKKLFFCSENLSIMSRFALAIISCLLFVSTIVRATDVSYCGMFWSLWTQLCFVSFVVFSMTKSMTFDSGSL